MESNKKALFDMTVQTINTVAEVATEKVETQQKIKLCIYAGIGAFIGMIIFRETENNKKKAP